MKKSTRFLVVCVVSIVQVHIVYAQEYYEWRNGEKAALEPAQNEWIMHAVPESKGKADSLLSYTPVSVTVMHKETNNQNYWVHARDVSNTERSMLVSQDKNLHIVPLFKVGEDEFKHPSRKIRIEWAGRISTSEIDQITKTYRLQKDTSFTAKWIPDASFYLVTPPFNKTSLETANELVEQGYAKRANAVMTYWIKALQVSPNDEHYGDQWHLPKTQANKAWDVTTGQGTLFAIMDDGVDLTHDDLNDNLLRDGQGQIISANFTDVGGNTAQPHFVEDAHGTNCVGIAAAVTNNTDGIAGASWNSSILGIRVAYRHPTITGAIVIEPDWAEAAINYASNHNADVLSISLRLDDPNFETEMEDNLSAARNNGVVIVAAAGNDNVSSLVYPASSTNTIAVGATNPDDERKHPNDDTGEGWGSNYGNDLNLTAPGVFMYSTDISGADGYIDNTGDDPDFNPAFNGTSSATPLVGGVVALMRSVNPNYT